jgi:hypothetical protein
MDDHSHIKKVISNYSLNMNFLDTDKFLLISMSILYFILDLQLDNRKLFLDVVNYFAIMLALYKFLCLVKYNDVVFYVIKLVCLIIINKTLIIKYNPIFNSLFFWVPFQDLLRSILLIKTINYFFEYDFKFLHIDVRNELLNFWFSRYADYQVFISIKHEYFSSKEKILKFVLILIIIKLIHFFYDENVLPNYYLPKVREKKYFICANLYNNENIMDTWTSEMLKLVKYVGEENVFISIVENGDSTDRTRDKLIEFEAVLNSNKIRNKIVTSKLIDKKLYERINFLVRLRNEVLKPIEMLEWKHEEFLVIFFNDIIYKWKDIVKLIMTNEMEYDISCGLDFYHRFYDTWVSRDLDGNRFKKLFPYFVDYKSQERLLEGKPVRVFSCWNGVAVINPVPLKKLKFRAGEAVIESECFLFCRDYWTQGFNRVLVNPNVKVTYEYAHYYTAKYIDPFLKIHSYIFYYFSYFFYQETDSGNLKDLNVRMNKNWKFYL